MSTRSTISAPPDDAASLLVSLDWVRGGITLSGDLDRDSAHHLLDAVAALAATAHRRWVLDTAAVTWCDAGGLRALAAASVQARESGCELLLVRPARCVRRLLVLTGLDALLAAGGEATPAAAPGATPSRLCPAGAP